MAETTQVVDLPQGPVAYVESGSGPPVVLLHGLLMDGRIWDEVMPGLPSGFRYLRPTLPLGSHQLPMKPDADLGYAGMVALVADFLEALDLSDVTLVVSDWGGPLLMPSYGLDKRVSRLVICPSEAFGNVPPGLPGKLASLLPRLPGGTQLGLRQLRVGFLRNGPLMLGPMTVRGIGDDLAHSWTESGLRSSEIRRDFAKFAAGPVDRADHDRRTQRLADFEGAVLVLWGDRGRMVPVEHGSRLAALIPGATLVQLPESAVLVMHDRAKETAAAISEFLTAA